MDVQALQKRFEPFSLAMMKYVRSEARFDFIDEEFGHVAFIILPDVATQIHEEIPQFRMPGESVGLTYPELVAAMESYARHYKTSMDIDETIRLFTNQVALLRVCGGASRQAAESAFDGVLR